MNWWGSEKRPGFTIVELLIVIVVIAILATITIVAYNGIRDRAVVSQVQNALAQANKKVLAYAVDNADQYPAQLADIGITDSASIFYQYSRTNTLPYQYAITASNGINGSVKFHIASGKEMTSGLAPGHNLMPWDEPNADNRPVSGAGTLIDTTEFYSGTASMRIAPSQTGKKLRTDPVSGSSGQVVTVSLWFKSAVGWNGTTNNSKIRFAVPEAGPHIVSCGFTPSTTWTQVTCSQAFTQSVTSMSISVGNDGSTGFIWIDDVSVSIQ